MNPTIATCIFSAGVLGLFWLNKEKGSRPSGGLWLAVVWLFLCCSRSVAQWIGQEQADSPMEGNPLDRTVYLCLIVIGLVILFQRKRVLKTIRANWPIVIAVLYCALSILWSDYPEISFKRWIKALGDLVIVLVVLTDRDRVSAIKELLTRTGFLLIPFSILFIKYYPFLGRAYSRYEGAVSYNGVALTKNDLGMICLIFGLCALWRILEEFHSRLRVRPRRIRPLIAQGAILLMVLWLFRLVNSMTSLWCFLLGAAILVSTHFRGISRRPAIVHWMVGGGILVPFSMLFLNLGSEIAHNVTGRDVATLTDRTMVWAECLKVAGSPLFGTGFESFWLGSRLKAMWAVFWWHPNEAHDGYVEVFLNLGWVGIVLLGIVIVTGYRTVIARIRENAPACGLMLAYFVTAIVYNFTEAAFFRMMTPIWVCFLLAVTRVPFSESNRTEVRRAKSGSRQSHRADDASEITEQSETAASVPVSPVSVFRCVAG